MTVNQFSLPTEPQSVASLNPDPLKQRIYLGSAPGLGKTTQASKWAPATTLLVDLQRGTDLLPGEHFVQHVSDWNNPDPENPGFEQVIDALAAGGHHYTGVVIDPIDLAYKMADAYAGAKFGHVAAGLADFGKGTSMAEGLFRRAVGKLLACRDLGVWFIGHLDMVDDNGNQKWVPKLDKRVRDYVTGECQLVLIAEKIGNRTVVHTQPSQRVEAKSRIPMPATIDMDAHALYKAMALGIKQLRGEPVQAIPAESKVEPQPEPDAAGMDVTTREAVTA